MLTRAARLARPALVLAACLGLVTACGTATGGAGEAGDSGGSPAPVSTAATPSGPVSSPGRSARPSGAGGPTVPSAEGPSTTSSTAPPTSPAAGAPSMPGATVTAHGTAGGLPTGATAYADGLVRAWGAGQRGAAAAFASATVVDALFTHADPGGAHWKRSGSQGAAGTIYVTYRDTSTGDRVTLAVRNEASAKGEQHAVREARFD